MKTLIEISQLQATKSFTTNMVNLPKSEKHTSQCDIKGWFTKKNIALTLLLLLAFCTLCLRCNPVFLILSGLVLGAIGVIINEFVEFIRLIREME